MSADPSASQTSIRELRARRSARARDLELRKRIGELVSELMRDILGLVVSGSAAEIGELLESAAHPRSQSGEGRETFRAASRGRRRSTNALAFAQDRGEAGRRPSMAPNSPFDITSPGELLASPDILSRVEQALPATRHEGTDAPTPAVAEAEPAAAAAPNLTPAPAEPQPPDPPPPGRAPSLLEPPAPTRRRAAAAPAAAADAEAEAESERRPRIVLREGEQLVSATGSGVVIRRARIQNR